MREDIKQSPPSADAAPHVVPFTDSEMSVSMAQQDDLGLMFVVGRSSMGSQPSSSSHPNSPPPSAAYYHYLDTTSPESGRPSASPRPSSGARTLTYGKRALSAASGELVDRSSVASSVTVAVPSGISVNRVEEIPEDEDLPPVYSSTPLPGENCRAESLSATHHAVDGSTSVGRCAGDSGVVTPEKR